MKDTKIVKHNIQCGECKNAFVLAYVPKGDKPVYCPFCGESIEDEQEEDDE